MNNEPIIFPKDTGPVMPQPPAPELAPETPFTRVGFSEPEQQAAVPVGPEFVRPPRTTGQYPATPTPEVARFVVHTAAGLPDHSNETSPEEKGFSGGELQNTVLDRTTTDHVRSEEISSTGDISSKALLESPIVTDARQVGGVVINGLLCRHGTADAVAIAEQIGTSGIAAFEGPLKDELMRAYNEALYTRAVSGPLNYNTYKLFQNPGGNQLHAILGHLVGKGPRSIRLIDIAPGLDGWDDYQQSLGVLGSFQRGMHRLPPVDRARIGRGRLTESLARSNTSREAFMSTNLEKIVSAANKQAIPPATTLVVGLSHLPFIRQIGEPVDSKESQLVEARVAQVITPGAAAVIAHRSGTDPSPHINRALLQDYANVAFKREPQANTAALQAKIKTLQLSDVEGCLTAIDQTIARTRHEWEKANRVRRTIRELFSA